MSFWSVLAYCILTRNGVVVSLAASFILSYVAQWLALLYDALAFLYNNIYESITETDDTSKDAETRPHTDTPGSPDEVS